MRHLIRTAALAFTKFALATEEKIKGTDYKPSDEAPSVIPGGKGEGHKLNEFKRKEIELGMIIEKEHSPDPVKRLEITSDHLAEPGNEEYYSDQLREEVKKETGFDPQQQA